MNYAMTSMAGPEAQDADLKDAFEFIPGRLYYVPLRNKPHKQKKAAFFSIDEELVYWNFFLDFGPLNMGQLFRFCQILRELLSDPRLRNKTIYYYSSTCPQKRANAAFLVSSFVMLYMNKTPEEAYAPFVDVYPPFPPFHDATPCACTYKLTVLDCLRGMSRAVRLAHIDLRTFDVDEYEYFERVECGDLNWLIKDKFLAFAGPHEYRMDTSEGYQTLVPEDYIGYFKKKGVKLVIRLNRKQYDERRFTRAGIKHLDLFYPDGSNPPDHILRRFIEACEAEPGAIAVHCKAGLGRTGTCIGCYMMKHYEYTAAEVIGWLRVCRPGSVIGPQQHYLEDMEAIMHHEGRRLRHSIEFKTRVPVKNLARSFTEMSLPESKSAGRSSRSLYEDDEDTGEVEETKASNISDIVPSQGDKLRNKKAAAARGHRREPISMV